MKYFPPKRDFRSLSVKDLLEAREAYHVFLSSMENVVATAIGRFRIRTKDPNARNPERAAPRGKGTPRTLANSVVKPWSWPCVLVFVRAWSKPDKLGSADELVPPFLYLPDGRIVPTCVVAVEPQEEAASPLANLAFPSDLIGGGYPLLIEVQGEQHVGSIGCLVTDGNVTYALTNRHVTGRPGHKVESIIRGQRQQIGVSDEKQVGKLAFEDVYPGWPGKKMQVNLDVGLIRVDEVSRWTAQVFGIGELRTPVDLNTNTISLDLIGCPVRAFGGASGELIGEIQALFYRYRSIGGVDYVADLLIGCRPGQATLNTRPGDSGTLWCFDPGYSPAEARNNPGEAGAHARRLRPIAVQWGGQKLMSPGGEVGLRFALATCLSTACRLLDVEVVRDWNIGLNEYWGKVGHYKIAAKACDLAPDPRLRQLLAANLDRISFDDTAISSGDLPKMGPHFIALADVPDLVWRNSRKKDATNHFTDMDEEGQGDFRGQTLLSICADPAKVNARLWGEFYDSLSFDVPRRGALPFRIWQIFDEMITFVRQGKVAEYICAAGVLAHYVGDACQPLHISRLHHGASEAETKVHAIYEDTMLNRFAAEMIAGVNTQLGGSAAQGEVSDGHAAAVAAVDLMRRTLGQLPPQDILEAFNAADGRARAAYMWQVLGERTVETMADGCLVLAMLWQNAWSLGHGEAIADGQLGPVDKSTLMELYNDADFLPAMRLKEMADAGIGVAEAAGGVG